MRLERNNWWQESLYVYYDVSAKSIISQRDVYFNFLIAQTENIFYFLKEKLGKNASKKFLKKVKKLSKKC